MTKILITDIQWPSLEIEERVLAPLNAELVLAKTGEEAELVALAPGSDAILTCWKLVTPKVIDAAPECKIICRYGIGLDNIAIDHATSLGIPVTYTPTYCLEEVAEHALGLIVAMQRRISRFDASLRAGQYPGVPFAGIRRIAGKTLGLAGYGNIGRTLAHKARGIGLNILTHDPKVPSLPQEEGRACDFDTLLAESDYLSVHMPMNPETAGLFGRKTLAKMKPGTFLLNTARGGLVDVDALLEALNSGHLAGAALDVHPVEPPDLSHPIFQHPHFLATPHVAFFSEESVENLQTIVANQVLDRLTGKAPEFLVNPDYQNHPPRTA